MTADPQSSMKGPVLGVPNAFVRATRMLPGYRWWKPILALLLAAVLTVVFTVAVILGFALVQGAIDPQALLDDLNHGRFMGVGDDDSYLGADLTNPLSMAFLLLSVVVMLPAAGLAALVTGLGGFRTMASVEGKLRMRVFKQLGPWVLLSTAVVFGVQLGMSFAADPSALSAAKVAPLALLVIVICAPLQCAAEEFLFRGLLMQALGSWIPIAVIPVVLQAAIFASMHTYNSWGILDVAVVGICFGILAAKTGGLEAGILLHATNNTLSFILGSLFMSQVVQSDITPAGFFFDSLTTIGLTALILWIAKRKGFWVGDLPAKQESGVAEQGGVEASCGPEQSASERPVVAVRYCHECGAALVAGARFCHKCGTPVYKRES